MAICSVCGCANKQGARFCKSCGDRITTAADTAAASVDAAVSYHPCSACQAPVAAGAKFCKRCGQPTIQTLQADTEQTPSLNTTEPAIEMPPVPNIPTSLLSTFNSAPSEPAVKVEPAIYQPLPAPEKAISPPAAPPAPRTDATLPAPLNSPQRKQDMSEESKTVPTLAKHLQKASNVFESGLLKWLRGDPATGSKHMTTALALMSFNEPDRMQRRYWQAAAAIAEGLADNQNSTNPPLQTYLTRLHRQIMRRLKQGELANDAIFKEALSIISQLETVSARCKLIRGLYNLKAAATPEALVDVSLTSTPLAVPVAKAPEVALPDAKQLAEYSDEASDPELLEIFLEEAEGVLATIAHNLSALRMNADDKGAMTAIRRAFHTLKGSGRMVGLNNLGEVAWSVERIMNVWLEEQKPLSDKMLGLVQIAHSSFDGWIKTLASDKRAYIDPLIAAKIVEGF